MSSQYIGQLREGKNSYTDYSKCFGLIEACYVSKRAWFSPCDLDAV